MFTLNCKGRLMVIDKPMVMGIINATPDSFYGGSRKNNVDEILDQAEKMLAEGAAMIDIGGQSTRPGSEQVGIDEELKRTLPAIETIRKKFPDCYISIDTFDAAVAQKAVNAGADMVNDISGGNMDAQMLSTVAALQVPFVCMHMQGTPANMQQHPVYENVTKEILDFFIKKMEECRLAGINDVIIDIGFGFGKTIEHNFQLLKELSIFKILQKPLLLGVSRKSSIYKTLQITPEESLNGTTVLHTVGLLNGAHILRVHDVKEAKQAIDLLEKI
jgi:dihydropteroate synthase